LFYHVPLIEALVLALYGLSLAALCVYGAHRLVLLWLYAKYEKRQALSAPLPDVLPFVTVQMPVYNERFVVEELIETVCGLDYPADRIEFQVLDDSTDETTSCAALVVGRMAQQGHHIELLHRDGRDGYKAGALAAGLQCARGELIAVFDADFRPTAGFLKELVGHFSVAQVGCVQARWTFSNRERSLLTRAQAIRSPILLGTSGCSERGSPSSSRRQNCSSEARRRRARRGRRLWCGANGWMNFWFSWANRA
jgi:cellulose synthase/poly-beta-1,6-N-acetylglucosamine synthase-like glycosyltransferase